MSLIVDTLQYGTGSHTTSSETANALATDLVNDGVVGSFTNTAGVAPATGGFSVNAQGTPDATVAVTAGVAYVTGTPTSQGSQRLRVKLTAGANVTIPANATGGTRYDWIYIKLDPTNMANPNTAADNVATLTSSRSTSATTDNGTGVTYGYCIAVVTVANGFTTIVNGNIADKRVRSGAAVAAASVTPSILATGAASNTVLTGQGTTSGTYVDLATVGPVATVTIGANGLALVTVSTNLTNSVGGSYAYMSFAVSGATTLAATDVNAMMYQAYAAAAGNAGSFTALITGLTPGANTFTAKYSARVSGTATFTNRIISVLPL